MATNPPDNSLLAILLGGGSVLGVVVTKGFDYLKARLRKSTGDRRQAESGLERLVKRLETRLDSTEKDALAARQKAEQTANRLVECERRHAVCTAQVTVLKDALNQALEKLHLPCLIMEEHSDG